MCILGEVKDVRGFFGIFFSRVRLVLVELDTPSFSRSFLYYSAYQPTSVSTLLVSHKACSQSYTPRLLPHTRAHTSVSVDLPSIYSLNL